MNHQTCETDYFFVLGVGCWGLVGEVCKQESKKYLTQIFSKNVAAGSVEC